MRPTLFSLCKKRKRNVKGNLKEAVYLKETPGNSAPRLSLNYEQVAAKIMNCFCAHR